MLKSSQLQSLLDRALENLSKQSLILQTAGKQKLSKITVEPMDVVDEKKANLEKELESLTRRINQQEEEFAKYTIDYKGVKFNICKRGYLPPVEKKIIFTGKSLLYREAENNRPIWLKRYQVRQCCQGRLKGAGNGECPPKGETGQKYCELQIKRALAKGDKSI